MNDVVVVLRPDGDDPRDAGAPDLRERRQVQLIRVPRGKRSRTSLSVCDVRSLAAAGFTPAEIAERIPYSVRHVRRLLKEA